MRLFSPLHLLPKRQLPLRRGSLSREVGRCDGWPLAACIPTFGQSTIHPARRLSQTTCFYRLRTPLSHLDGESRKSKSNCNWSQHSCPTSAVRIKWAGKSVWHKTRNVNMSDLWGSTQMIKCLSVEPKLSTCEPPNDVWVTWQNWPTEGASKLPWRTVRLQPERVAVKHVGDQLHESAAELEGVLPLGSQRQDVSSSKRAEKITTSDK